MTTINEYLNRPMNAHKINLSKLLYELDMPDFQAKFYVYNITSSLELTTRIYVQIEYSRMYEGIYYVPWLDITYTEGEYEACCYTKEDLIANLSHHFLAAHIMTRDLDEYFH